MPILNSITSLFPRLFLGPSYSSTISADPLRSTQGAPAADETAPLLTASSAGVSLVRDHENAIDGTSNEVEEISGLPVGPADDSGRFPYVKIVALCVISLGEPLAYFSIFPFINEMISRIGRVPETEVGYWSGFIESSFSLVQMVLMIFYGRAADRLGRKPVLIFSMTGVSCAVALFGLSQTLWQMVVFRCTAGLFAGSVVTIRCMLSESCDKAGQARAFSWFMFTRQLGILLGPMIGGFFARPADQYPNVFGNVKFFVEHPYALPSFVTSAFCAIATLICVFVLEETLQRNENKSGAKEAPMSTWAVLKSPGVSTVLFVFSHAMFLGICFTALAPLSLYTPISKGGFSFTDQQIAVYLAIGGASQSLWMLLAFPPLQKKLGTVRLLTLCGYAWPVMMLNFPIMNIFRRNGWNTAFYIIGPTVYALGCGVSMAFAGVQLCINDVSPSSNVLATINALALTLNSAVRTVAPVMITSAYAVGADNGWINGQLGWLIITAVAAGFAVSSRYIPKTADESPSIQEEEIQRDT